MFVILLLLLHVSQHTSGVEGLEGEKCGPSSCEFPTVEMNEFTVVWNHSDNPPMANLCQQEDDDLQSQNEHLSYALIRLRLSDSGTSTCTVRRSGAELGQIKVQLQFQRDKGGDRSRVPILLVFLVLAVVMGAAVHFRVYLMKVPQVEVDSGAESVQLPFLSTLHLPEDATVKWSDSSNRTVHFYQKGSDRPEEQHWFYKHRTKMKRTLRIALNLSLTLKYPTDRDTNTYTCTIFNGEGNKILMRKQVKLHVRVPQVEVEDGVESVQLPCKTTLHLPGDATVEWTYNCIRVRKVHQSSFDQPKEHDQAYRDRTYMKATLLKTGDLSLTLKYPTDSDNCTYTCTVYNREGRILMRKQVKLQVKVCQVEVEEGVESVQLPFRTTGDLSSAQVEWWRCEPEPPMTVHKYQNGSDQPGKQEQFYRGRTKMKDDSQISGDLSLTLKYPTDRDTGKYICRVESKGLKRKKTVLLTVMNCQVEVEEGVESVQLTFKTTQNLPEDAEIMWRCTELEPSVEVHMYQNGSERPYQQHQDYRGRTKMNEDLLKTGDLSLILKQPTLRDSGEYCCEVYSKQRRISRQTTVQLKVKGRVQIQDQTGNIRNRRNTIDPTPPSADQLV